MSLLIQHTCFFSSEEATKKTDRTLFLPACTHNPCTPSSYGVLPKKKDETKRVYISLLQTPNSQRILADDATATGQVRSMPNTKGYN